MDAEETPGNARSPAALGRLWYQALASRDEQLLRRILHPDLRFRLIGSTPVSTPTVGIDAWVEHVLQPLSTVLDPVRITPRRIVADDTTVVGVAHGVSRTRKGEPYASDYAHVMEVEDGRIVDITVFLDTAQLARAFAASTAPGTSA